MSVYDELFGATTEERISIAEIETLTYQDADGEEVVVEFD